jgi:hypothetical protein
VQSSAWSTGLRVTADATGVVSHVGAALPRMLADRAGRTTALSPDWLGAAGGRFTTGRGCWSTWRC